MHLTVPIAIMASYVAIVNKKRKQLRIPPPIT